MFYVLWVCFFSPLQNGMLSALPYLGCAIMAVLSGQFADYLRETCGYPTVLVRKSFSLVGTEWKRLRTGVHYSVFDIFQCFYF